MHGKAQLDYASDPRNQEEAIIGNGKYSWQQIKQRVLQLYKAGSLLQWKVAAAKRQRQQEWENRLSSCLFELIQSYVESF